MKITAQKDIIESVIDALSTNLYGKELADRCTVSYNLEGYSCWIEFLEQKPVAPEVWFWLGYYINTP